MKIDKYKEVYEKIRSKRWEEDTKNNKLHYVLNTVYVLEGN